MENYKGKTGGGWHWSRKSIEKVPMSSDGLAVGVCDGGGEKWLAILDLETVSI